MASGTKRWVIGCNDCRNVSRREHAAAGGAQKSFAAPAMNWFHTLDGAKHLNIADVQKLVNKRKDAAAQSKKPKSDGPGAAVSTAADA